MNETTQKITTRFFKGKNKELKTHKNSLSDTGEWKAERTSFRTIAWSVSDSPIWRTAEEKDK